MRKFKRLGIREQADVESVKNALPGVNVDVNIDPVMLLPRSHWERIAMRPAAVESDDEVFDFSYLIANGKNRVEILPDGVKKYHVFGNASEQQQLVFDPREFLWMIMHCRNFTTTSYHGNLFGIIFRKSLQLPDKREFSVKSIFHGTMRIDSALDLLGAKMENGRILNYDEVQKNIEK